MSHKRKGMLSVSPEWAKHLRKIGRRIFWSSHRLKEKQLIRKEREQE